MYRIWMRCYPQPDMDMSDYFNIGEFKSLTEANKWIAIMEQLYSYEEWRGHWLYGAKFYAEWTP